MILKIRENESWKFIDNIDQCTVATQVSEGEGVMQGHEIHFAIGSNNLAMFLQDTTYLLNNEGKTIERLIL